MRNFLILILATLIITPAFSQEEEKPRKEAKDQVYRLRPWVDVPITTIGLVTNYFGVQFLKSKPGVDPALIPTLSPEDVNKFDRGASKQDPSKARSFMKTSDYVLFGLYTLPVAFLAEKEIKKDWLKVGFLFLETGAIMGNAYAWGVGHINKLRPYVYNTEESFERRTRKGSFNSFYAGHAASAASCTFFMAKVFHDYNPGSKYTKWVYAAAIIPPAFVGYCRYKSGMHFPTDILVGIPVGAAIGTLVPHLHKTKNPKMSLTPIFGPYNGVQLTYNVR